MKACQLHNEFPKIERHPIVPWKVLPKFPPICFLYGHFWREHGMNHLLVEKFQLRVRGAYILYCHAKDCHPAYLQQTWENAYVQTGSVKLDSDGVVPNGMGWPPYVCFCLCPCPASSSPPWLYPWFAATARMIEIHPKQPIHWPIQQETLHL